MTERIPFSQTQKENFKIGVVSGGFEPERESSIIMGKTIINALQEAGYGRVKEILADKNIASVLLDNHQDFIFVAMFCKWGEDGVIQGLLEALGLPYSGSGIEASAISKNKYVFTRFAKGCGIPVPATTQYTDYESLMDARKRIAYPAVIKPISQGYSIGISLLESARDVKTAGKEAFKHSTKVIVQQFIDGKEFTVGILDTPDRGSIVLPIVELELKKAIQDLEIKDGHGLLTETVPARMPTQESQRLGSLALRLYQELGCLGVSRFDVRKANGNKIYYFLENNTCPGIINPIDSDLPKMLAAANISLTQFVDYMIISGFNRKQTKIDSNG